MVEPKLAIYEVRADSSMVARNWILGVCGGLFFIALIMWILFLNPFRDASNSFSITSNDEIELDSQAVEQSIRDDFSSSQGVEVDASCPSLMRGTLGSEFKCLVTLPDGSEYFALVTAQSSRGEFVWEILL